MPLLPDKLQSAQPSIPFTMTDFWHGTKIPRVLQLLLLMTVVLLQTAQALKLPALDMSAVNSTGTPLSENLQNAVEFELSNRAHGSIADDPFYTVPPGTADAEPGTLLKLEEVTNTSLYTLAPGLAMSRFMYQSTTSNGSKVPVSGFILWPYLAKPYSNGIPVIAWSHGTSGISAQCAPSNVRNLWHHFQFPFLAAQAGYAVVGTDYAGLGVGRDAAGNTITHEYLASPAQAHDLLYSIPAARSAFPELSPDFVLVGHSQGGGSVWNAAQQMVDSPVQGHLGTVALAPLTRFLEQGDSSSAFLILMVPTLEKTYPGFKRSDVVQAGGLENLEILQDLQGCNSVMFNLPNTQNVLQPDWKNNTYIQQFQESNQNGGKPISGPMLVMQGDADVLLGTKLTGDAVNRTIDAFPEAHIEYYKMPYVTHGSVQHAGSRIYMDWIADRFARKPTCQGVQEFTTNPLRPGKTYQADTNFYLALETEPWQAT